MKFNHLYSQSKTVRGTKPNKLFHRIEGQLPSTGSFLDLGCGQGRDALWMAEKGFQVTAVDSSEIAIQQLQETAKQRQLNTINTQCARVEDIALLPNQYDVINANNILQFLIKDASLNLIQKLKEAIKPNGFILISAFTVDDPMHHEPNASQRTFFRRDELKESFVYFEILHSFDGIIHDPGHPGKPEPHTHGIVELIAQKIRI